MQKLLAALFSAALMFGMVACTVEDDDPDGGTTIIEDEDGGAGAGAEGEGEGETDVEVDVDDGTS
jgi:hypothetical protein